MVVNQGELRQRNLPQQVSPPEQASDTVKRLNAQETASTEGSNEKKTFGRTPSGIIFTVPETHDMVSQLLSPTEPKNFGDVVVVAILAIHILLLYLLPQSLRVPVFALVYFFWRGCYNAGIGYLLHEQSHHRRLVCWAEKFKLFANPAKGDNPRPALYRLLKQEMEAKIPKNYDFDDAPIEFNTWLLFRRLTDLVLMSDFVSYCCFAAAASNNPPPGESITMGLLRWSVGVGLVLFNLWVKLDAHRVVKDYAWYWGDFFFLVDQELTFDGVFEMAPHPMYSVGYAGFYGISLMAASYKVLFVSIVAHAAQFAFLVWVENPHIDKTYSPPAPKGRLLEGMSAHDAPLSTPPLSPTSFGSEGQLHNGSSRAKPTQMHNLVGLSNMDFHRLTDTTALLLQFYLLLLTLATPSTSGYQLFFVLLAAAWRLWYSIGIGFILNRQSLKKYWTRHFVKYGESTSEAWRQWQGLYHISMTMTYGSFIAAAWKVYAPPTDWGSGMALLRHILGLSMVTLQIWTAVSIYESLGEFGWFFGDFFFDHAPKLTYSGIYRFLNNPERVIGLAGLWGAVLITNSKAIFALALLSHIASLAFIQFVERPHMQKLYGRSIREDSGLSRSLRKSLPPGIWKWQGSVDKMLEEGLDFVEDFIESARPRIAAGVNTLVKDSTMLFKHPTRLTITRLEPDMAGYDPKDYSIEITNGTQSNNGKAITFSYGEPIRVRWTAPLNHSNKDWVGLYRVADNALWTVTRASSAGRWVPTNPGQYDGPDFGTGSLTQDVRVAGASRQDGELSDFLAGEMEFLGSKLFWTEGVFEFRYHHNGKHNVMAISRAFEVRIGRFDEDDVELDSQGLVRGAIEQELLPLVWNCCDRDPEIAPNTPTEGYGSVLARDSKYARRIVYAVGRMFGIEFAHEVVLADGNIRNLAWRICNAKQVLVCLCNDPVPTKLKSDESDTMLTKVHEKAPYSMSASKGRNTPTK